MVACGACSLLTSLDGLSGGADASDASSNPGEGGPLADSATDSLATGDTGQADAAAARFCASLAPQPTYCDDFDDGVVTGNGWTTNVTASAASVSLVTADASSPPNALRCVVNPLGIDGGSGHASLRRAIAGPVTRIRKGFDIRVSSIAGTMEATEISTKAAGSSTNYYVGIAISSSLTLTVYSEHDPIDGGSFYHNEFLASGGLVLNQWARLVLDLNLAAVPPTVSLTVNGVVALPPTVLDDGILPGAMLIGAGLTYVYNPPMTFVVDVDNLVVDITN